MQFSFQSLCSPVQMYSAYAPHRVRSGTWIVVIFWLHSQSLVYTALCQFAHIQLRGEPGTSYTDWTPGSLSPAFSICSSSQGPSPGVLAGKLGFLTSLCSHPLPRTGSTVRAKQLGKKDEITGILPPHSLDHRAPFPSSTSQRKYFPQNFKCSNDCHAHWC